MHATTSDAATRTVSEFPVSVPPRPDWLPPLENRVPQRPRWLPKRASHSAPQQLVTPADSTPQDVLAQRRRERWGRDGTSFLASLTVHLCLLLAFWQIFRLATRPQSADLVISCELDQGEGAESELLTLVDSPVPKTEPLPAQAAALDATKIAGGDETVSEGGGTGTEVSGGGGGTGIGFFGTRTAANSVVFVVDKSGSMGNEHRLLTAKAELASALQSLQPHQRFYVIFYDDTMHCMFAPRSPTKLLPATRKNIYATLQWVETAVRAGGGTEPRDSLITALQLAPEAIFFLTDGDIDPDTALAVTVHNMHEAAIHTLCFSNDYGEQVMRRIADENRGRYRFVDAREFQQDMQTADQLSPEEQAAANRLKIAQRYLKRGRPFTTRRILQKLLTDFPDTTSAAEAQQLLDSLAAAP